MPKHALIGRKQESSKDALFTGHVLDESSNSGSTASGEAPFGAHDNEADGDDADDAGDADDDGANGGGRFLTSPARRRNDDDDNDDDDGVDDDAQTNASSDQSYDAPRTFRRLMAGEGVVDDDAVSDVGTTLAANLNFVIARLQSLPGFAQFASAHDALNLARSTLLSPSTTASTTATTATATTTTATTAAAAAMASMTTTTNATTTTSTPTMMR